MSSSKKKKIGHILFLEDVFIPLLENRGFKVLVLSICPHVCPIALYLLLPQIGRIDFKLCGVHVCFSLLNIAFCWSYFPLILELCIHYSSKFFKRIDFNLCCPVHGKVYKCMCVFIAECCILLEFFPFNT